MFRLLILISFLCNTSAGETLPNPFVVGGSNATRGQFKYFGSLRYRIGNFEFHGCGANILNARWALSAAHCTVFDENLVDNLDIVVGSVALSDDGTRYNIIEIINHPAYVFINLREYGIFWILNDVSLVKTNRPIEFNEYVQPIAIERGPIRRNSNALFAGHGAFENNPNITMSEYLQYINLRTISEFECRNRANYLFLTGQIQALPFVMDNICIIASSNSGICNGDSGSGLIINGKLAGVASFILDPPFCANGFPEFFTRISSFANWIDYHTQNV